LCADRHRLVVHIASVVVVKLDVYRSCSRSEKREVLHVYWHRDVEASSRIALAAQQYGPWAILCLVVLALELVPVIALSFGHVDVLGAVAVLLETLVVASLCWAIVRYQALRATPAT